jgi:hypothetical protein
MKNFIKPNEEFPPINCHVFQDYDRLDALAAKRGYICPEIAQDDRIADRIGSGLQNSTLHSGWVATMGDSHVSVESQLETLKDKIKECLKRNEDIIIGFCQTGHFSIGYSIYRKQNKPE